MYWKVYDWQTKQKVYPPEPVRCGKPEIVAWQHPWTPHIGPLSHKFQRFSEHDNWVI